MIEKKLWRENTQRTYLIYTFDLKYILGDQDDSVSYLRSEDSVSRWRLERGHKLNILGALTLEQKNLAYLIIERYDF